MQLLRLAPIGVSLPGEIKQARRSRRARSASYWRMAFEITQSVLVGPSAEQEMRRPKLKPAQHPDTKAFIPASVLLRQLHDEAPSVTLPWAG